MTLLKATMPVLDKNGVTGVDEFDKVLGIICKVTGHWFPKEVTVVTTGYFNKPDYFVILNYQCKVCSFMKKEEYLVQ